MTEGRYEFLVRKALEDEGSAPWAVHDLDRIKSVLTEDFCSAVLPDCDRNAVLDWLSALPPEGVQDLLERLNAHPRQAD
jgi:hypothetical protein